MNVVIVNDFAYVNGGAARVALFSAKALAARGVQVHVFAGAGPVDPELLEAPNLKVTCLDHRPYNDMPLKRSLVAGLWDKAAATAFESVLDVQPDSIVHFHSNRDTLSSSVFAPVFKRKLPVVYTCHEYGLTCPYANFFDFKTHGICSRKALSLSCLTAHCNQKGYSRKVWTYTKQAIQNGYLQVPNRLGDVVFVSDFSRRIIEPYLTRAGRRHVLSNPVDAVPGQKRKLTEDSPFVFVGSLVPGKDPVIAAAAAHKLDVPIRFIGDGELHEEVMRANPNAVITGWLKPEQVREEMLKARAIVLPTRWYETQGLVVQEAAALGVPAIVTRTCAASENIQDRKNGFLIDASNEGQLAAAMEKLSSGQVACEMGAAAYGQFWSKPPTLDNHVNGLLSIYEGALKNA
ncbi:MAG TPA: glycosyltransferase family 4 protein [Fimbriimonadaceae bacterium]|jgi:glycosyltransferase involved in cell wall biosynthesis